MAINIRHVFCTHVDIYYTSSRNETRLHEHMCNDMDEIAEHVCDILINHNFTNADVYDSSTGEILMIVERT